MDTNADGQGEDARRRFPELPPPEPPRSAGMLVWGILALVIGQVLYQAGQQQAVVEAVSGVSEGDGAVLTFFGVALSLVGLVRLPIGGSTASPPASTASSGRAPGPSSRPLRARSSPRGHERRR